MVSVVHCCIFNIYIYKGCVQVIIKLHVEKSMFHISLLLTLCYEEHYTNKVSFIQFMYCLFICVSVCCLCTMADSKVSQGTGFSMNQVVGLPSNSYKPITNRAWVRTRLCKLQKKGALDSQPQVIKFTSCLPMVGGSLRVLRVLPPLKLVVMIQLKYC